MKESSMFIIFIVFLIIGGVVAFFVHKNHSGLPSGCTSDGGLDGRAICDGPPVSGDTLPPGQRQEGDNIVNNSGDVVGTQETNIITYDIVGVSNPGVSSNIPYLASAPPDYLNLFKPTPIAPDVPILGSPLDLITGGGIAGEVQNAQRRAVAQVFAKQRENILDYTDYMYVFFETPGTIHSETQGETPEDESDMAINIPSLSGAELNLTISPPDSTKNAVVSIQPSALRVGGAGSTDYPKPPCNQTGFPATLPPTVLGKSPFCNPQSGAVEKWSMRNFFYSSGSLGTSYSWPSTGGSTPDVRKISGSYIVKPGTKFNLTDTTNQCTDNYIAAAETNTRIRILNIQFHEDQSEVICQVGELGNNGFKTGNTVKISGIKHGTYGGNVPSTSLNTYFVLTADAGAGSNRGPYLRFRLKDDMTPITTETIKFYGGGGPIDQDVTAHVMVGNPKKGELDQMLKWNHCTAPFTGIDRGCSQLISSDTDFSKQNYIKIPTNPDITSQFNTLYKDKGVCAGSVFGVEKGALQIKIARRIITPATPASP